MADQAQTLTTAPVAETQAPPAAPAAPATLVAAAPEVPAAPTTHGTTQDATRKELYTKLYGDTARSDAQPAAPAAPAASAVVAAPANSEVPTSPVTSEPTAEQARIAQLEAQLMAITSAVETLRKPAAPATAVVPEKRWYEHFAAGDPDKGTAALKAELGVPDSNAIVQDAVVRMQAEQEVTAFVSETKTKNADIMSLEPFITLRVEKELQNLVEAGKIKSIPEYVDSFKKVTTKSIEEARIALQKARASGKDDAMTVKKEVLSASTIAPNTVNKTPGEVEKPVEAKPENAQDYFAKRQAWSARLQGMSTSN